MKRGQVGGAKFGMLAGNSDDAAKRKEVIVGKIKTQFKDSGSVLTNLLNIANTDINERGSKGTFVALEAWFTTIEHQDELFDLALEIIKEKVSFKQTDIYNTDRINSINNDRSSSWNYIESILTLIRLENSSKDISVGTKMEYLKRKELITLLQFPKRLNNIFVQSLANVFILLKYDKVLLEKIKDTQIRAIALDEYRANIYANTYALTSQDPMDGYYLDQSLGEVQGIQANGAFWKGLFDEIATPQPGKLKLTDEKTGWTTVAAAVFKWYKSVSDMKDYKTTLFKYFNEQAEKGGVPVDARLDSPEKKYDTVDVYGVPFIEIMKAMDVPTLEFILHLAYTISKNEASTIAEIAAASSA